MELAAGGTINLLEMLIKGLKTQEICVWGGQTLLVLGWTYRGGCTCSWWGADVCWGPLVFSETLGFSRKRRLGLDESPVVVWENRMGFFPLLKHSMARGHCKSRCMMEIHAYSTLSLSIPQRMSTKSKGGVSHWQCFVLLRDLCTLKPHFSLLCVLNEEHWSCHVHAAPHALSRGEGTRSRLNSHFPHSPVPQPLSQRERHLLVEQLLWLKIRACSFLLQELWSSPIYSDLWGSEWCGCKYMESESFDTGMWRFDSC